MRTTITIDDDLYLLLRKIAADQQLSYKEIVNTALKKGIEVIDVHKPPATHKVRAKHYGFQPGVDPEKLNQLVDELVTEG